MSQTLEMLTARPGRRYRAAYAATSASVEVIVPDADKPQDTGSREGAHPGPGRKQASPPMARALTGCLSEVGGGMPVVIQLGDRFYLLDASITDHLAWYKFRFVLGSLRVAIRGEGGVRAYLDEHADLFDPVESVCRAARKEFGPDAELSLRVYHDPEADDQYLLIRVRLKAYPADMMRCIQSVSDAHESVLWDKSGSILVTTDFHPLR